MQMVIPFQNEMEHALEGVCVSRTFFLEAHYLVIYSNTFGMIYQVSFGKNCICLCKK